MFYLLEQVNLKPLQLILINWSMTHLIGLIGLTTDHNRTHAADVLQGVYYLTSQPIPGFAQIPADSTDSPLHKTSIGPLPQSYVKHLTVCEETYGIIGANYPALELMALYTAAAMHDFDHPGLSLHIMI